VVSGEISGAEESLCSLLALSNMLLPKPEKTLNEEAEESDRAFFGEEPLSALVEPRFLELALSSGMNRLSSSLRRKFSRRRVNSSRPSSTRSSSSRCFIYWRSIVRASVLESMPVWRTWKASAARLLRRGSRVIAAIYIYRIAIPERKWIRPAE
jgi:hypothetical protein